MSTAILRDAAALMRAQARSATSGTGASDWFESDGDVHSSGGEVCTTSSFESPHIASWNPTVALAVADLLTAISWFPSSADPTDMNAALAVARAYLGEAS